ncbi:MAG: acyl carrier protein, partial [Candidatus Heimdallarchaeota archaeon]|nr:acyl carrier protein [Candidatus Heimdallarchaeota archaeon]
MSEEIQEKFLDFVARNFMVERDDIPLDQSLIDEGIIDSFGLVEIASYIESDHGITVNEEQMNRANFGSIIR